MSAPTQERPSDETAELFYSDAPARPDDALYTKWLGVARADRADALKVILNNEAILDQYEGKTPPEMAGFCDLPTLLVLLRSSARDNDAIAREIIAAPESAQSRERMENAVATAERWR